MGGPKRPWWWKKRWQATVAAAVLSAYPVSFLPACWTLLRINPVEHPGK